MGFGPQLADLDGDAKPDMISGSWPGEIYWFRGEGGGKFSSRRDTLKLVSGAALKAGSASAVAVTDWDADGLPDLLIGVIDGAVFFARNEVTAQKPAFAKPVMLSAGGKVIRVAGGDSGPCVADWDGDGKPDLLVGCGDGSVLFFRNTGTKGQPVLESAVVLVPPAPHKPVSRGHSPVAHAESEHLKRPGFRAKVCVADWNGDGRADLLVGDFNYADAGRGTHGFVWVYLRKPAAPATTTTGAE